MPSTRVVASLLPRVVAGLPTEPPPATARSPPSRSFTVTVKPELSITAFRADCQNVLLDYAVIGNYFQSVRIALYASTDGVSLDQQLQVIDVANVTRGEHTQAVLVGFVDLGEDYALVAKVDSNDAIAEVNEADNTAVLAGGAFLADQLNGSSVLMVQGSAAADAISVERSEYIVQHPAGSHIVHHEAYTQYIEYPPPVWVPDVQYECHGNLDENGDCDEELTPVDYGHEEPQDPIVHDEPCAENVECEEQFSAAWDEEVIDPAYETTEIVWRAVLSQFPDACEYTDLAIDQVHIRAAGGDDDVSVASATAWIFGGLGDDLLAGGDNNDLLQGNAGNDSLDGGEGDDSLSGDDGNDTLTGGDGTNTLSGGEGDDTLTSGPNRDILDGNEGDDTLSGSGDYYALDTSSGGFSGHYLQIESNFRRIADLNHDDRHITVTLTGPDGLSISYVRNMLDSASYTGDTDPTVIFPLFDAGTQYTVTRTVSGGLTGNRSETFNSSGLQYIAGTYVYDFGDVLTTNAVCNKSAVDESLSPECNVPNPPEPTTYPRNDDDYATISGGELTVDAAHGLLANDYYSGSATIQIIAGPTLGTLDLNTSTGAFTYTASANKWGQDVIKYKITSGGQTSPLLAAVYIAVNKPVMEARAPNEWDWTFISDIGNPAFMPSAWVGQSVNVRVGSFGLVVGPTFPANSQYSWSVSGVAVGGWVANSYYGEIVPLDLEDPSPIIYWADNGAKLIQVTVTPPAGAPTTLSGNVVIKRPTADVFPSVDATHKFSVGAATVIQLGNTREPNAVGGGQPGITFIYGPDPKAGGEYEWVQVLQKVERYTAVSQQTGNTYKFKKTSGGYVLDTAYPYGVENPTDDSPSRLLPYDPQAEFIITRYELNVNYKMYLMWKPAVSGIPIWVPLRYVPWDWNWVAQFDANTLKHQL